MPVCGLYIGLFVALLGKPARPITALHDYRLSKNIYDNFCDQCFLGIFYVKPKYFEGTG